MATIGSAFDSSLSVHLSRALDEIGFNEETVRCRRWSNLQEEKLLTVRYPRTSNISCYRFGSQSEGTTTPGLHSDIDTLICTNAVNVIKDWAEWQQGRENLLMLLEDTPPGYCRLQVLRSDVPLPMEDLPDKHCAYDQKKRVLRKSSIHHLSDSRFKHNGPANTLLPGDLPDGGDFVAALRCSSLPFQTYQWARRPRRDNWPPQSLVRQAVNDGIFLVAVGHKLSPTPDLEWRISFSRTERKLMFSMNITQLKCFVVLKMLMKCFVFPKVGDSITSYHCKTAVFHTIEDTCADFWQEENLVECIVQCLRLLLTWVANMFCPHFITPTANLFAGKITAQNQHIVHGIVKDLQENIVEYICRIDVDDLGSNFHRRLSALTVGTGVLDSQKTKVVICELHCFLHSAWSSFTSKRLLESSSLDAKTLTAYLHRQLKTQWIYDAKMPDNDFYDLGIGRVRKYMCLWLGSLMAAESISCRHGVTQEAKNLLKKADKADPAVLLKLASILYCSEETLKTEAILTNLDNSYRKYYILSICNCYDRGFNLSLAFTHQVYTVKDDKERASLFADCVKFSPQERHCAPPALRHEFDRAIGDDMTHRDPKKDDWMNIAAVDSLPFLRFLQYLTYGKVGKRDQQKVALEQLEHCLKECNNYSHLETGWNLLGQCMEQEKQPESAMRCYRTSLAIRPRNNAANWHIQNLRYQSTRKGEFLHK